MTAPGEHPEDPSPERRRRGGGGARRRIVVTFPAADVPGGDADDGGAAGRRARPQHRSALARAGEAAAAVEMERLGYRILARNLRTTTGEIDLLVRRGRMLVAVEVKTRSGHPAPERAVAASQVERLRHSLRRLAATFRPRPGFLRVDVVAVRALPADKMEVLHFAGTPFVVGSLPS